MIIAGDIEIPDSCPLDCPGREEKNLMGGICYRCPILNCKEFIVTDENGNSYKESLIQPEHYRRDWACEYEKWFTSRYTYYPQLKLTFSKIHE